MFSKNNLTTYSPRLFALFLFVLWCIFFRPWHGGYWLLLDDVPTPTQYLSFAPWLYDGFMWHIIAWLGKLLSTMVWQKIFYLWLFVWLWLAGFWIGRRKSIGAGVAGWLLIVCNPFVFDRFIHGQFNVIGWLVLLTRSWVFLLSYIDNKQSYKPLIITWLLRWLACSLLYHSVFIVALFGILFLFTNHTSIQKKLTDIFILWWCTILPILNVIGGILIGESSLISTVSSIDNQSTLFRIYDAESPVLAAWRLDGFWRGMYQAFDTSYWSFHYPSLAFLFIFIFVVLGYLYLCTYHVYKKFRIISWGIVLLAYILALAGNGWWFDIIHHTIYTFIPWYSGMRDPQKWMIIILILYIVYYTHSFSLVEKTTHRLKYIVLAFMFAVPVLYGHNMIIHTRYFQASTYPNDWYQVKQYFHNHPPCQTSGCYDILVVPWHLYMAFHFGNGIIGNPSDRFFLPHTVLQWDNIEIWSVYSHSTRRESKHIEMYLGPEWLLRQTVDSQTTDAFVKILKAMDIHYILLLKEVDWALYNNALQGIVTYNQWSIVIDYPSLRLYKLMYGE